MWSKYIFNPIALKRCLAFALVFFIFQNSRSQSIYKGGSGGGLGVTCYNQASNSFLNIYFGGNQDGYSSSCFTQADNLAFNIYSGGMEDGSSSSCYTQSDNIAFNIYYGGNEDGSSFSCYTQSDNILYDIYNGGSEDGFSFTCYTQSDNILYDIYHGGSEDGFSFTCYTQTDNILYDIYHGGSEDGFSFTCYTQPDNPLYDIYHGGSEDGFSFTCYTQPDNPLYDIYHGGSEDGFVMTCYTQPDNLFYNLYHGGSGDGFTKSCATLPGYYTALPIELIDFTAVPDHSSVKVNWVTASETNNDFFTVERSGDGITFETVTQVDSRAPGGNSTTQLNYQIFDESPLMGWSYYRLKQTDFDGHSTHSNIVAVNFNDPNVISIYPNPIQENEINVYGLPVNEKLNITLRNTLGQLIMNEQYVSTANGKLVFSVEPFQLSMGIYLIEITAAQTNYSGKLIIEK